MAEKLAPSTARLDDKGWPICVTCGGLMRPCAKSAFWNYSDAVQPYGWKGNSIFCTQRCAAKWGIIKASTGLDGP